ncbi:helix-turn-helix domain-containing protein [Oscillospiraceae bacterium OttesenSCG-928-G22]|nr:helix-turn-helix domain-containing protein [Oscillospiraceae bacterium OttesenSCG-928-G22]
MIGGYFSLEDRQRIAQMWEDYQPASVIACALMVDPSTIHRELKLGNADGELDKNQRLKYDADLAQYRFHENLRRRGRKKTEEA